MVVVPEVVEVVEVQVRGVLVEVEVQVHIHAQVRECLRHHLEDVTIGPIMIVEDDITSIILQTLLLELRMDGVLEHYSHSYL